MIIAMMSDTDAVSIAATGAVRTAHLQLPHGAHRKRQQSTILQLSISSKLSVDPETEDYVHLSTDIGKTCQNQRS